MEESLGLGVATAREARAVVASKRAQDCLKFSFKSAQIVQIK